MLGALIVYVVDSNHYLVEPVIRQKIVCCGGLKAQARCPVQAERGPGLTAAHGFRN